MIIEQKRPDLREQVIARYATGLTGVQVAADLGIGMATAYRILRRAGVAVRLPVKVRTVETIRKYHREYARRWCKEHPEKIVARRVRPRTWKRSLKEHPCVDCGKTYHPCAMEFDHVRGQKSFKVSYPIVSKERVLAEVGKCDLVCVLCHRDRTFKRFVYADSKTARNKRALQDKVNALKSAPCSLCGLLFKPHQMDFDHIDPSTKIEKVCNMVHRRAAFETILQEISKCRLLCAVCHRMHTEGVPA